MAATLETVPHVLVVYASKHGTTQGIAERIAETLRRQGLDAVLQPAGSVFADLDGFDAFVVGGAAYMGSWLKEVTAFVRRNQATLAARPTWLFSSGPLGTEMTDAQGQDLLAVSEPKEFVEFKETVSPRGTQVFFGALDPGKLGLSERLVRSLPAGRALLPEGDFRNWQAIEAWAESIAHELVSVPLRAR